MLTMFLEDPMPVVFLGIVVEAALGFVLLTTRRGILLAPMAGVLALVLGGVWLERAVVTEKERVEATLDEIAAALKANNLAEVLSYLSPSAQQTRGRASWALGLIEVTDAKIRNLTVTINPLTSPPTAEAKFDGTIFFRGKHPMIAGRDRYPARFTVELELDGDRWLVTDHFEYQQISL